MIGQPWSVAARVIWSAVGASVGMSCVVLLVTPPYSPFLLVSAGGTAVFLFGMTRADAAQPRALFGGHLGTALIGVACFHAFGTAWWAYALAESLALGFMLVTRTVHPPAGANPIIMINHQAGFGAALSPVLLSRPHDV